MIEVCFDAGAVQANITRILNRKVDAIQIGANKDAIAGEYAKHVAKYVPYKTGKLLRSAKVKDGTITYSAKAKNGFDYADIQYNVPFPQESRSTPGTYDHWNRHLTASERQLFYEDVAKIIKPRPSQ